MTQTRAVPLQLFSPKINVQIRLPVFVLNLLHMQEGCNFPSATSAGQRIEEREVVSSRKIIQMRRIFVENGFKRQSKKIHISFVFPFKRQGHGSSLCSDAFLYAIGNKFIIFHLKLEEAKGS